MSSAPVLTWAPYSAKDRHRWICLVMSQKSSRSGSGTRHRRYRHPAASPTAIRRGFSEPKNKIKQKVTLAMLLNCLHSCCSTSTFITPRQSYTVVPRKSVVKPARSVLYNRRNKHVFSIPPHLGATHATCAWHSCATRVLNRLPVIFRVQHRRGTC